MHFQTFRDLCDWTDAAHRLMRALMLLVAILVPGCVMQSETDVLSAIPGGKVPAGTYELMPHEFNKTTPMKVTLRFIDHDDGKSHVEALIDDGKSPANFLPGVARFRAIVGEWGVIDLTDFNRSSGHFYVLARFFDDRMEAIAVTGGAPEAVFGKYGIQISTEGKLAGAPDPKALAKALAGVVLAYEEGQKLYPPAIFSRTPASTQTLREARATFLTEARASARQYFADLSRGVTSTHPDDIEFALSGFLAYSQGVAALGGTDGFGLLREMLRSGYAGAGVPLQAGKIDPQVLDAQFLNDRYLRDSAFLLDASRTGDTFMQAADQWCGMNAVTDEPAWLTEGRRHCVGGFVEKIGDLGTVYYTYVLFGDPEEDETLQPDEAGLKLFRHCLALNPVNPTSLDTLTLDCLKDVFGGEDGSWPLE